jgi:hypothetical protein
MKKKLENRISYLQQSQNIKIAEMFFQQDWGNLEAWKAFNMVQQNLKVIQLDKLERCKNATCVVWVYVVHMQ